MFGEMHHLWLERSIICGWRDVSCIAREMNGWKDALFMV
jgi:hypothetical protein